MPAEFPLPSVSGSNPTPLYYEMLPEEFSVSRSIYDDGGADYKLQHGGNGLKRFIVRYDGLTIAQAAIIDAWVATMFYSEDEGSAFGANFRHHIGGEVWTSTNGTLYSNVHLAPGGFKTSHSKVWSQMRELMLEQRP